MSEKLFLQWNEFKEHVASAFGILREDNDFADVTLACEDGKQFEAHKVILASSSLFFQNLLRRNKHHPHPLIFMRGMKSDDLAAVIDFLYCGKANVFEENLDSFLATAEELQLEGLMGKRKDQELDDTSKKIEVPVHENVSNIPKLFLESFNAPIDNQVPVTGHNKSEGSMKPTSNDISEDFQKLDNQINSMMVRTSRKNNIHKQPFYKCILCGKEAEKSNLKGHIEVNHLEGISIPCKQCEKMFKSRNSLAVHKSRDHKESIFKKC